MSFCVNLFNSHADIGELHVILKGLKTLKAEKYTLIVARTSICFITSINFYSNQIIIILDNVWYNVL